MNQTISWNQNQNSAIVSMGYDNIETNITLSQGHGSIFPDPSFVGPYNIIWWNASDYPNPTNDPFLEIVQCIAKIGDTLVIMRSQQQTQASHKNIYGKLYSMMPFLGKDLKVLSYYNTPQPHGISSHTGTIGLEAGITFNSTTGHTHNGTDSTKITVSAADKLLGRVTVGAGSVEEITCTTAGRALLDDADAATQRTTLGLGSLATQSGTFSGTSSGTNTGDNAPNSSTHYIGTTAIALNRSSATQALTGITSIDGSSASCTGTAANANTLGGASPSESVSNSTIVKRTANGYINCNYINTTADITAVTPSHVAIQNSSDSYLRWQTLDTFKTALGVSTPGAPTNLLTPLTPTFSGWVTNPSTNAQLASETMVLLTTRGSVAANQASAYIQYDLVSVKFVAILFKVTWFQDEAGSPSMSWTIQISNDNVTFTSIIGSSGSAQTVVCMANSMARCRYIRFIGGSSGGVDHHMTYASHMVYLL